MPPAPAVTLVMGVAGAGKSTVARALATALDAEVLDGDDLQPAANIERMRRGIPLDDATRRPWLLALRSAIDEHVVAGRPVVVASSALKGAYRELLLTGLPDAVVVHLRPDRATLERRLRSRPDHFMPATLLDSQLADLEPPSGAIVVDGDPDVPSAVATILRSLAGTRRR
ncbi:MAG: gluconokinase [Chloroflexota bacterium]